MAVARRTDRLALDTLLGFILEPEALLIRLESLELDKERTTKKEKEEGKRASKRTLGAWYVKCISVLLLN